MQLSFEKHPSDLKISKKDRIILFTNFITLNCFHNKNINKLHKNIIDRNKK